MQEWINQAEEDYLERDFTYKTPEELRKAVEELKVRVLIVVQTHKSSGDRLRCVCAILFFVFFTFFNQQQNITIQDMGTKVTEH